MALNHQDIINRLRQVFAKKQAVHSLPGKPFRADDELWASLIGTANKFLNEIEQDILGSPSRLQAQGQEHGYSIIDPELTKPILLSIEKKYDSIGKYLSETVKFLMQEESARAAKQIEVLQEEIAELDKDLDEASPESKASIIKKTIENKEKECKEFMDIVHDSSFFNQRKKVIADKIVDLEMDSAQMHEEIKEASALVKSELETLKQVLLDFFKKEYNKEGVVESQQLNPIDDEATNEESRKTTIWQRLAFRKKKKDKGKRGDLSPYWHEKIKAVKGLKRFLKEYPLIINAFEHIKERQNSLLNVYKRQISRNQDSVLDSVLKEEPLLPSKSQILLFYLISLIIFLGETYLVYAFITDTLGFDFKDDTLTTSFNVLFSYIFSLAYPLALGMFFKERLSKDAKDGTYWWMVFIISGLAAISIPNALTVVEKRLNLDFSSIDNSFSILTNSFWNISYVIGVAIFLPILSVVLARVGAWVFSQAQEQHRKYVHVTRQGLLTSFFMELKTRKWAHQILLEEEIKGLKDTLSALKAMRDEKNAELIRSLALSEDTTNKIDIIQIVNLLKETASQQYLSGFIFGKSQQEHICDEEYLIRLKNKRLIFPFNFSSLLNDQPTVL